MKKLISFCLAITMLLSFAVPAFAVDTLAVIELTGLREPKAGFNPYFGGQLLQDDVAEIANVTWMDLLTDTYMDGDDVFQYGNSYRVQFTILITDSGTVWSGNLSATINGNRASCWRVDDVYAIVEMYYDLTVPAEHECTGGYASCLEPAVCDICGEFYGEPDPENHDIYCYEKSDYDPLKETHHDVMCALCGEIMYEEEHTLGPENEVGARPCIYCWYIPKAYAGEHECTGGYASCTEPAVCDICGESYGEPNPENHDFYCFEKAAGDPLRETHHDVKCGFCGLILQEEEHTFGPENHLGVRPCIQCWYMPEAEVEPHECTGGKATCCEKAYCEICGNAYGEFDPEAHTYLNSWSYYDEYVHSKYCIACAEAYTERHYFVNGFCTCGAAEGAIPVVDENLTFGAQLYLENDLTMAFRVKQDKLTAYDISTAYLVVERDVYATGAQEATVEAMTIREYTVENGRLIFSYPGIAAAQMNDAIRATLHIKDADGKEYVSPVLNTSVATYLDGLLTGPAFDSKMATLIMDMLNYGAAAQVYFDRHADAPVNEAFDSFKDYARYASADFRTALENLSATENAEGKRGKLNLGLDLGTRIGIQYKVTVPSDTKVEDVTLIVMDASGNILERLTVAGNPTDNRGRYLVNFYGSTSRDMRRLVYATAYANGEAITGTYAYSISTYAWGIQENAATQPEDLVNVTRAMMLYGDSASAYFAN